MSDVSGGPGWWQANDGKWYPPEQHPNYTPPPPPPPPATAMQQRPSPSPPVVAPTSAAPQPQWGARTGAVGKIRSPWVVILLSIVTIGIYSLYWQYAMFKEMKDYSGEGIGGVLGLVLALLLAIVNVFVMPAEVGALYAAEGKPKPVSGPTGFWVLLPIVGGFVWLFKVQGHLNKFWQAHGAVAG